MAEEVRFELTEGCPSAVFKTAAFSHSATPPQCGEDSTSIENFCQRNLASCRSPHVDLERKYAEKEENPGQAKHGNKAYRNTQQVGQE